VIAGWSKEYYYISDFIEKYLIGAKIIKVTGGFENKFRGKIYFDTGHILTWFEDSEGPGIDLDGPNVPEYVEYEE